MSRTFFSDTDSLADSDRFAPYLRPGVFVDSDHPAVIDFARSRVEACESALEAAVRLYYAVRDEFLYDPYGIDTSVEALKASRVIEVGRGFCVPKAALLAAAARAVGIPARVGYADVRNHLTSPRLREAMGTDLFVFHGYTELWLEGRWVKATPAFNRTLCEKAGIKPLEFDGRQDSLFHEFDVAGRRHMEYVRDRGTFADLPREQMLAAWAEHYPGYERWAGAVKGDFQAEAQGQ